MGKIESTIQNSGFKYTLWVVFALVLRWDLIYFRSFDIINFLEPWYQFILSHDRFWSLRYNFANYNLLYLYFLVLWSYLFPTLSSLYAIKSISILFDFLGAWIATQIVAKTSLELGYEPPKKRSVNFVFLVILFTPTVFLNSAYWGQCDITYTTGLLIVLYGLIREKYCWAIVAWTLALGFKLQAIFLAPLLAILVWRRIIPWRSLLFIPLTYGLTLVPAAIAGRPWDQLLSIYWQQFQTYEFLTLNAPSLYQWISNDYYRIALPLGLIFAGIIIFMTARLISHNVLVFNAPIILLTALFFCLLMPFCLPKMHDRYLFPADVISVVLACSQPRYVWVAMATVSISLLSYAPYLLGRAIIPLPIVAIGLALTIGQVWRFLWQETKSFKAFSA